MSQKTVVIPDREIRFLPLKLSQGASFFQDPKHNGPATAWLVHALAPSTEAAVDPSNHSQSWPHFIAKSSQLGV